MNILKKYLILLSIFILFNGCQKEKKNETNKKQVENTPKKKKNGEYNYKILSDDVGTYV